MIASGSDAIAAAAAVVAVGEFDRRQNAGTNLYSWESLADLTCNIA